MGKSQRVISFILAGFLIVSTVGAVWLVFAQSQQQDELNDALTKQQEEQQNTPQEGKLEGTQLVGYTPTNDKITELKVETLVEGTGPEIQPTSTITAHYTGALAATGVIFQSSKDTGKPFTSPLSNLIQGWQQGLVGVKEGSTVRLYIPSDLAYGSSGSGNIPPNSDLIFDIEVISVN